MAITLLPAQKREPRYWVLTQGDGWDLEQYQVKMLPIPLNWTVPLRMERRTEHPALCS